MEGIYKLTIDKLPAFILGGKSNFVISDINNPELHIEFKIKEDVKNKGIYYVRYKSLDWIYIGYIKQIDIETPLFYPKNDIKITDDMIEKAIIFKKFILYIYHLNKLPRNIEVLYTGICSMCGRKLTDPKYIEIGIGKVCLENSI